MASEDKIRVLIVDDVAETRENIRKLLQFDAQVEVVGASRNGVEGVELAIETQADVVLMDINMPDMDGITATEAIRNCGAFVSVTMPGAAKLITLLIPLDDGDMLGLKLV